MLCNNKLIFVLLVIFKSLSITFGTDFTCIVLIPEFGSMCWKVPITIATKSNPEAMKFVLEKMEDIVTVEGVGPEDYILVR